MQTSCLRAARACAVGARSNTAVGRNECASQFPSRKRCAKAESNRETSSPSIQDIPYLTSRYEIDPTHASAHFKVRHLMVATVRGELGPVTGEVLIDHVDITKSQVNATIDATGIDTRNADRDAHLRSGDFLDVESYPTITFHSKRVELPGAIASSSSATWRSVA